MAQCQRGRYGAANSLAYDASASKRTTLNAGSLQRPRHSEAATPLRSLESVFSVRFHPRPRGVRLYDIKMNPYPPSTKMQRLHVPHSRAHTPHTFTTALLHVL